ncbi:Proteasome subunit beta type-6 [Coemansia sp. RSA 1813]|nr:Proteasome subunit beta type-6 [Coemansia sp. RSA 1646]KAJ1771424.1 Proteasome subunit beta type-6 [Coemansia sp. RSA 1843]KAJ2089187.1 Proteasome subunit beta type-6 [Coemansia sp. RSA 986]KAJ2213757.1 Proteasome subunit beta type-6 [Coemansia sp. RSA 487]KAJ2569249.1 Proteasome subunit beta type-6 [Coemansia sp. RSA 1813]
MELNLMRQEPLQEAPREVHSHGGFNPYVNNEGTTLGICGSDFALVASDTRQSNGQYNINSRYTPKAFALSNGTVLATTGCFADGKQLVEDMEQRAQLYFHKHDKQMSTPAMAQMLSQLLYSRRFFPYYVFPIFAGLDPKGKGLVYNYDALGNIESVSHYACGSASALLTPFLDNQIKRAHQRGADPEVKPTREQATKLAIDAFTSATERDIYTGDWLEIFIIDSQGVHVEKRELKHD